MGRRVTPTIVVAGTSSGVGKTTVAVGLMHTLRELGLCVQPFKVGPDFLDGMQHEMACGVPSINLDGWMMRQEGVLAAFDGAVASADIAVIEGCMGLHDGRDGMSDEGSTAQVAKWLGAPVLLVIDAWNLSRSAAAMVHGYKTFDADVNLACVLFNRVAGLAHAAWLRQAMASAPTTANVNVLGCLPSDSHLVVKERLLGLLPPRTAPAHPAAGQPNQRQSEAVRGNRRQSEAAAGQPKDARLATLRRLLLEHADLAALRSIAAALAERPACPDLATLPTRLPSPLPTSLAIAAVDLSGGVPPSLAAACAGEPPRASLPPVRIAVARDAAFCFLYHDNLRLLREAGATIFFFSPLADEALPADADALYLIGGYPELHAPQLHANRRMRAAVRRFCERGGFVWAECGGLMYLARQIVLRPVDTATATEAAAEAAVAEGGEGGTTGEGASAALDGGGTTGGVELGAELVHEMCGLLPFDVTMRARMNMGYCTAVVRGATAALLGLPTDVALRCQQYHFSEATVDGEPAVLVDQSTGGGAGLRNVEEHAFDVRMEAPGALAAPEGVVMCGRTVATYCHVHLGSDERLAAAFVRAARSSQSVVSLLLEPSTAFHEPSTAFH